MSKLLHGCDFAAIHPGRQRAPAARRPDHWTDHLGGESRRAGRFRLGWLGVAGADLTITPANIVVSSGTPLRGTALTSITAGQSLYADGTTGTFGPNVGLADANGSELLRASVGISLHAALAGQPIMYLGTDGDVLSFGPILTVNTAYITSATPGGICPIADNATGYYLQLLGIATTTSLLTLRRFNSGVATA